MRDPTLLIFQSAESNFTYLSVGRTQITTCSFPVFNVGVKKITFSLIFLSFLVCQTESCNPLAYLFLLLFGILEKEKPGNGMNGKFTSHVFFFLVSFN